MADDYLRDPAFRDLLQRVRQTDNFTNAWYVARSWLLLLAALAVGVAGLEYVRVNDLGWGWFIPIVLLAGLFVGAAQHHLGVLGHEGSHRTLFRHRLANELASDWLCMYPLFTTTYMYRLQHLAHHQFVNDPDRDPNVVQMRHSDTWPDGPLRPRQVLGYVVRLASPFRFVKFMRVRIKANAFATGEDVYRSSEPPSPTWPKLVGTLCVVGQLGLNAALYYRGRLDLLLWLPPLVYLTSMVFFAVLPSRCYQKSRVKPELSLRSATLQRMTCYFVLFHGLAWAGVWLGMPLIWYWMALYALPLLTLFPLLVLLRQYVQHANGGRGKLTNTRVFLGPSALNFFVLPVGQDYHLPHHLFASVPHYRLRALHEALVAYPDYGEAAVSVEGVMRERPRKHPTLLAVLGAASIPPEATFIDGSVLDDQDVSEREAISLQEQASQEASGAASARRGSGNHSVSFLDAGTPTAG